MHWSSSLLVSFTVHLIIQPAVCWPRTISLMIFLVNRDKLYFGLCVPRLEKWIILAPTDPGALHPCLVYSICLAVCVIAGTDLSAYETLFCKRTQEYLDATLSRADQMEHFMWASVILGWYWIQRGEHLPAHAIATSKCGIFTNSLNGALLILL